MFKILISTTPAIKPLMEKKKVEIKIRTQEFHEKMILMKNKNLLKMNKMKDNMVEKVQDNIENVRDQVTNSMTGTGFLRFFVSTGSKIYRVRHHPGWNGVHFCSGKVFKSVHYHVSHMHDFWSRVWWFWTKSVDESNSKVDRNSNLECDHKFRSLGPILLGNLQSQFWSVFKQSNCINGGATFRWSFGPLSA